MLELIRKHLFRGIGWGCAIILCDLILADLIDYTPVAFENFTLHILWNIAIIISFISTAIVYEFEFLNQKLKIAFHLTVALIVLILASYATGTAPLTPLNIAFYLVLFLTVWTFHYLRERREIRKINERIQQLKR